jgi:long-chain acyl-CoA synthetase
MNLTLWLHRAAAARPDAPALMTGTRLDADYAEFARRAGAIARALHEQFGVRPGDRVGLFMNNRTEYLEAMYGLWWAGAAAVPINAKLHPKEAAWIIGDSECKLVFVSDDVGAALDIGCEILSVDEASYASLRAGDALDLPVARDTADLAWLFYTSGTTGRPKGAMESWGNLRTMALCYFADVDDIARADAMLYAAPISHGAGMYVLPHILAGARHVVPESGGFDPGEILTLAAELRDVSMFAAPTMVRRLVDHAKARGVGGDGLKTIVYGGGPMYRADIEDALATLGPRFVQIYGQAEAPMAITALGRAWHTDRYHPRYHARLTSVGTAQSATEVRVTKDGEALGANEIGEIEVRGPCVMLGYWNNVQATADAIKDGWLTTGDVGALDEDGFLTLHDRSKDMIISGGTNIYSREVEDALLSHADVAEVAVIGRPHPDWGEEVVACIVLHPDRALDEAALDAHCLDQIARFKRPKAYVAVTELPKNNYGKVVKKELRERLAAT